MANKISFDHTAFPQLNAVQMLVKLLLEKYRDHPEEHIQLVLTGFKAAKVYLDKLSAMNDGLHSFSATELDPIVLAFRDAADIFFTISENRQYTHIQPDLDEACQVIGGLLASVSKAFKSEIDDIKLVA